MGDCQVGCELVTAFSYAALPLTEAVEASVSMVSEKLPWIFPLSAAVAGGAVASLSGLVVDRIPRIKGWRGEPEPGLTLSRPPSHCEGCGAPVPAAALVPVVGWFLAEGRCGDCGARVPWIYPAVEAAVALASLCVVAVAGPTLSGLAVLLLLWLIVFCSWIDIVEQEIPDFATVPLFFAGLLWSPFEPDMQARALGAILSGVAVLGSFKLTGQFVRKGDTMSLGDVFLATALGAWVGMCAVPALLLLACLAYVGYALPLRRKGITWVPMGPALCAGLVACLAFGLRFA